MDGFGCISGGKRVRWLVRLGRWAQVNRGCVFSETFGPGKRMI